jgi:mRNA interferase RelE/StbE
MVTRWAVVIAPETVKRLAKILNPDRRRLLTAIDALHTGPSGDIKPLKGRSECRLRVGSWRVIMFVDESTLTINILSVGPRGDNYKTLSE